MSSEEETRKLLKIREDLEKRINHLQVEVADLRRAIVEIDRNIARQGFRQPTPVPAGATSTDEFKGMITVKSKEGAILGHLKVEEDEILFTPSESITFTPSIPPFQSFFIDRVLDNMRSTDETRVTEGELSPNSVLSYEVYTEGDRILKLSISNYGGERRLREIQSSLRWTFDKMFDKIRQG
jgi:hypothetical protein